MADEEKQEQTATAEEAPAQPEPAVDVTTVIDQKFGQLQGRLAQVVGQNTQQLKREATEAAQDAVRAVLKEQQEAAMQDAQYRQQLVAQGLDEEQISAILQLDAQRRTPPAPEPEAPAAVPQEQPSYNDGYQWSSAERSSLGQNVGSLIASSDLTNVSVTDQRLWTGVTPGMSTIEAYKIVERNVDSLKPATPRSTEQRPAAENSQTPQTSPPPTTQAAPSGQAADYGSISEAAAAFAKGEINIDQYKAARGSLMS